MKNEMLVAICGGALIAIVVIAALLGLFSFTSSDQAPIEQPAFDQVVFMHFTVSPPDQPPAHWLRERVADEYVWWRMYCVGITTEVHARPFDELGLATPPGTFRSLSDGQQ